jgi:hypothetical protein
MDWDEFNRIAYAYRSWPGSDPQGVVDRYEELCEFVRDVMSDDAYELREYIERHS